MKHINREYGSFATPCDRCDLPYVWQSPQDRIGWTGMPCRTSPYTPSEQFVINKTYIESIV